MTIHACGDYDRWHPYLHALAADGLFLESGCVFMMSRVDLRPLRELFRTHVLTLSKKGGLIDDSFIKMIMAWHHVSGFDMHDEVRSKQKQNQRPPPVMEAEHHGPVRIEPCDDGWPEYEGTAFER